MGGAEETEKTRYLCSDIDYQGKEVRERGDVQVDREPRGNGCWWGDLG